VLVSRNLQIIFPITHFSVETFIFAHIREMLFIKLLNTTLSNTILKTVM
jgi:hypothetical protein